MPTILRELDEIACDGRTDLTKAIDGALLRSARPGMLVVVSDFFDPGPFHAALTRAASSGHDLALIQILAPEEIDPPFEGDLALEDAETGAVVDVTIDARAVESYFAQLNALVASLRALAKRHRATYVRVPTTEPLLPAIRRFVSRTVD